MIHVLYICTIIVSPIDYDLETQLVDSIYLSGIYAIYIYLKENYNLVNETESNVKLTCKYLIILPYKIYIYINLYILCNGIQAGHLSPGFIYVHTEKYFLKSY